METNENVGQIADFMKKVGAHHEVFEALIEACRLESSAAEIDERIAPKMAFRRSIYSPTIMRKLLLECGAIEYIEPEAPEDDGEDASEGAQGEALAAAKEHASTTLAAAAVGTPSEGDAQSDDFPAADTLVLEEQPEGTWLATDAGLAYLESLNPQGELEALLAAKPDLRGIYEQVLAFCAQADRSRRDISAHIMPLVEDTKYDPSYFVGNLEKAGGLEWRGAWTATDAGRTLVDAQEVAR